MLPLELRLERAQCTPWDFAALVFPEAGDQVEQCAGIARVGQWARGIAQARIRRDEAATVECGLEESQRRACALDRLASVVDALVGDSPSIRSAPARIADLREENPAQLRGGSFGCAQGSDHEDCWLGRSGLLVPVRLAFVGA